MKTVLFASKNNPQKLYFGIILGPKMDPERDFCCLTSSISLTPASTRAILVGFRSRCEFQFAHAG